MARLVYKDTNKEVWVDAEATYDQAGELLTSQVQRVEFKDDIHTLLQNGIITLKQWADEAEAITVTSGNSVAVLNTTMDRLAIFFDRFANLCEYWLKDI